MDYDYRKVRDGERFRDGTIIFIEKSRDYPLGHYLVRIGSSWMDPWINFGFGEYSVRDAIAGFRLRPPGRPIYAILRRRD